MKLLSRVLHVEAAALVVYGLVMGLVPVWTLETLFDQPSAGEYAWIRMSAIQAIGFASLMIVIARRLDQLWWACWAFVVVAVGISLLAGINAVFGLLDGVSPAFWWLLALGAAANAIALIVGLAKTGTERPPV